MQFDEEPLAQEVSRWLESCGYTEDTSALIAQITDCADGLEETYKVLWPALTRLDPVAENDEVLEILSDLQVEFEHIARHLQDAADVLFNVSHFISSGGHAES